MRKNLLKPSLLLLTVALATSFGFSAFKPSEAAPPDESTPGSLQALDAKGVPRGLCPLKHTDV